jgi:hypothetical protein
MQHDDGSPALATRSTELGPHNGTSAREVGSGAPTAKPREAACSGRTDHYQCRRNHGQDAHTGRYTAET